MMSPEEVHAAMLRALRNAQSRPEIIYAFERTGRVVTEENKALLTPAELAEWDQAIEEYRREHPDP